MKQYKEAQVTIVRLSNNIITDSPQGYTFDISNTSDVGFGEFAPERREIDEDYGY